MFNNDPSSATNIYGIVAAALSGGVLVKVIDIIIGRRSRRIDGDTKIINSAINLVHEFQSEREHLKEIISQLNNDRQESHSLIQELRLEVSEAHAMNARFRNSAISYSTTIVRMVETCVGVIEHSGVDPSRAAEIRQTVYSIDRDFKTSIGMTDEEDTLYGHEANR